MSIIVMTSLIHRFILSQNYTDIAPNFTHHTQSNTLQFHPIPHNFSTKSFQQLFLYPQQQLNVAVTCMCTGRNKEEGNIKHPVDTDLLPSTTTHSLHTFSPSHLHSLQLLSGSCTRSLSLSATGEKDKSCIRLSVWCEVIPCLHC